MGHPWVAHHNLGLREILFAMFAKHQADRQPGECGHRIGQLICPAQIGDGHLGTMLCQKARDAQATAMDAEPHYEDAFPL
ncbi:MAG: hypothetical protein Fur005_38740 [Roseiflexaceae bacterium]